MLSVLQSGRPDMVVLAFNSSASSAKSLPFSDVLEQYGIELLVASTPAQACRLAITG